ncbi:hypothetical protein ACFL4E_03505, partial [Candidatus Omnitrophota bacterium]
AEFTDATQPISSADKYISFEVDTDTGLDTQGMPNSKLSEFTVEISLDVEKDGDWPSDVLGVFSKTQPIRLIYSDRMSGVPTELYDDDPSFVRTVYINSLNNTLGTDLNGVFHGAKIVDGVFDSNIDQDLKNAGINLDGFRYTITNPSFTVEDDDEVFIKNFTFRRMLSKDVDESELIFRADQWTGRGYTDELYVGKAEPWTNIEERSLGMWGTNEEEWEISETTYTPTSDSVEFNGSAFIRTIEFSVVKNTYTEIRGTNPDGTDYSRVSGVPSTTIMSAYTRTETVGTPQNVLEHYLITQEITDPIAVDANGYVDIPFDISVDVPTAVSIVDPTFVTTKLLTGDEASSTGGKTYMSLDVVVKDQTAFGVKLRVNPVRGDTVDWTKDASDSNKIDDYLIKYDFWNGRAQVWKYEYNYDGGKDKLVLMGESSEINSGGAVKDQWFHFENDMEVLLQDVGVDTDKGIETQVQGFLVEGETNLTGLSFSKDEMKDEEYYIRMQDQEDLSNNHWKQPDPLGEATDFAGIAQDYDVLELASGNYEKFYVSTDLTNFGLNQSETTKYPYLGFDVASDGVFSVGVSLKDVTYSKDGSPPSQPEDLNLWIVSSGRSTSYEKIEKRGDDIYYYLEDDIRQSGLPEHYFSGGKWNSFSFDLREILREVESFGTNTEIVVESFDVDEVTLKGSSVKMANLHLAEAAEQEPDEDSEDPDATIDMTSVLGHPVIDYTEDIKLAPKKMMQEENWTVSDTSNMAAISFGGIDAGDNVMQMNGEIKSLDSLDITSTTERTAIEYTELGQMSTYTDRITSTASESIVNTKTVDNVVYDFSGRMKDYAETTKQNAIMQLTEQQLTDLENTLVESGTIERDDPGFEEKLDITGNLDGSPDGKITLGDLNALREVLIFEDYINSHGADAIVVSSDWDTYRKYDIVKDGIIDDKDDMYLKAFKAALDQGKTEFVDMEGLMEIFSRWMETNDIDVQWSELNHVYYQNTTLKGSGLSTYPVGHATYPNQKYYATGVAKSGKTFKVTDQNGVAYTDYTVTDGGVIVFDLETELLPTDAVNILVTGTSVTTQKIDSPSELVIFPTQGDPEYGAMVPPSASPGNIRFKAKVGGVWTQTYNYSVDSVEDTFDLISLMYDGDSDGYVTTLEVSSSPAAIQTIFNSESRFGLLAEVAKAVTVDHAGNRFTVQNHGYLDEQMVILDGTEFPEGHSANTTYYVKYIDGNNFRLSLTKGGAAITVLEPEEGVSFNDITVRRWQHALVDKGSDGLLEFNTFVKTDSSLIDTILNSLTVTGVPDVTNVWENDKFMIDSTMGAWGTMQLGDYDRDEQGEEGYGEISREELIGMLNPNVLRNEYDAGGEDYIDVTDVNEMKLEAEKTAGREFFADWAGVVEGVLHSGNADLGMGLMSWDKANFWDTSDIKGDLNGDGVIDMGDQNDFVPMANATWNIVAAKHEGDKFTFMDHGLTNDSVVQLRFEETPSGLSDSVAYYVNKIDDDNFTLSHRKGGDVVDFTTSGKVVRFIELEERTKSSVYAAWEKTDKAILPGHEKWNSKYDLNGDDILSGADKAMLENPADPTDDDEYKFDNYFKEYLAERAFIDPDSSIYEEQIAMGTGAMREWTFNPPNPPAEWNLAVYVEDRFMTEGVDYTLYTDTGGTTKIKFTNAPRPAEKILVKAGEYEELLLSGIQDINGDGSISHLDIDVYTLDSETRMVRKDMTYNASGKMLGYKDTITSTATEFLVTSTDVSNIYYDQDFNMEGYDQISSDATTLTINATNADYALGIANNVDTTNNNEVDTTDLNIRKGFINFDTRSEVGEDFEITVTVTSEQGVDYNVTFKSEKGKEEGYSTWAPGSKNITYYLGDAAGIIKTVIVNVSETLNDVSITYITATL